MQNKYYVNKVSKLSDYNIEYIGLFKPIHGEDIKWHGEGSFCGWYGTEYYDNVVLLAYYTVKNNPSIYNPKGHQHIEENDNVFKEYSKVMIGSRLWEKTLKAKNDLEAISKFLKEEFE